MLANEGRMLSSTFVRGDMLLTRSVRDVADAGRTGADQFVRDRDKMTSLGQQYAAEMARLLGEQGRPRVPSGGHTIWMVRTSTTSNFRSTRASCAALPIDMVILRPMLCRRSGRRDPWCWLMLPTIRRPRSTDAAAGRIKYR